MSVFDQNCSDTAPYLSFLPSDSMFSYLPETSGVHGKVFW